MNTLEPGHHRRHETGGQIYQADIIDDVCRRINLVLREKVQLLQ
jgi:hypothetical protein